MVKEKVILGKRLFQVMLQPPCVRGEQRDELSCAHLPITFSVHDSQKQGFGVEGRRVLTLKLCSFLLHALVLLVIPLVGGSFKVSGKTLQSVADINVKSILLRFHSGSFLLFLCISHTYGYFSTSPGWGVRLAVSEEHEASGDSEEVFQGFTGDEAEAACHLAVVWPQISSSCSHSV